MSDLIVNVTEFLATEEISNIFWKFEVVGTYAD